MDSVTNKRAKTIGKVALETGLNIETIRYYEKLGIVPEPERTTGGNRIYSEELVMRLLFIKRSRALGFGLNEISELLDMVDGNRFTCGDIHTITVRHLRKIEEKMADLKRLHTALGTMAAECTKSDISDCPIIDRMFSPDETGR